MRTSITPTQARKMKEEGKLQARNLDTVSFGGNVNFEIWQNETGSAIYRERTNVGFDHRFRWVFVAKIIA